MLERSMQETVPPEGPVRTVLAISALLVSVACARPSLDLSTVPTTPTPAGASAMVGMWTGTVYGSEADPGTPFTLLQVKHADGTVSGQIAFSGSKIPITDVKVLEASADRYVALIGPYASPHDARQVVARLEAQIIGGTLTGTMYARPVDGGKAFKGRFTAERAPGIDVM
jgi:hypothetical protein